MKKLLFSLAALVIIQGCTSPSKIMESWVGKPKSDLYLSWGPPNNVTDDGNGGQILIYGRTVTMGQVPGQVYGNYNGGLSYTAPVQRTYTKTRMFYVNSEGIIYNWRWEGW